MPDEPRVASLHTVRVPKNKLLSKLQENREQHKKEFDEALDGYWDAVALEISEFITKQSESLERNIERAKKKQPETRTSWSGLHVQVQKPVDHTDDYDRAIERLEWDTAEQVDLLAEQFDRYVLNKWPWIKEHITSITSFAPSHLHNYGR